MTELYWHAGRCFQNYSLNTTPAIVVQFGSLLGLLCVRHKWPLNALMVVLFTLSTTIVMGFGAFTATWCFVLL